MRPKDVAEYMLKEMGDAEWLYQSEIMPKIKRSCGTDFIHRNRNNNFAIAPSVLQQLRGLTQGRLVWDHSKRAWRWSSEAEIQRQVTTPADI